MDNTRKVRIGKSALISLVAIALSVSAMADFPDVVFEVTAQSGPLAVTVPILSEWGTYNPNTGTWYWSSSSPIEFWANDHTVFLGSLNSFEATIVGDPEVNLNFAVQAGPNNTVFHIASALLDGFDPIPAAYAIGYAHASYTLTDFDGNFATLTGIGATGGAYLAQYNGWAGAPGGPLGTTFAEGIYQMNAGMLQTVTEDFDHPLMGYLPIGDTVVSMSALVSFELSADDLASGTSNFVIIPEPAALVSLAVMAVVALRRR